MKIALLIFCAFLITTKALAQTWWQISPKSENLIQTVAVQDNAGLWHFLAFRQEQYTTTLYHLQSNKHRWDSIVPIVAGMCTGSANSSTPGQNVSYHYGFINLLSIQKKTLIFIMGFRNVNFCTINSMPPNPSSGRLKLVSVDSLSELTPVLNSRDSVIARQYRPPDNNLKFYYYTVDSLTTLDNETLTEQTFALPVSTETETIMDFINDPRNPDKFYLVRINEEFTGGISRYRNRVYTTVNNGKDWELTIEVIINPGEPALFWIDNVILPPTSTNHFLVNADFGIVSVNEKTKKIDTVLRGKYYRVASLENEFLIAFGDENTAFSSNAGKTWRSISSSGIFRDVVFQKNTTTAFAYMPNGTIYRSKDLFETVEEYSTHFKGSIIRNLIAIGEDSIIVATDGEIWANYALPVSVAEEIPFKNDELIITPNPANSALKISFLKTDLPQQLSIYNSLGQLVFKTEFSDEFVWDFKNDVPDGVYTVAVQSGGKNVAKQVVIMQ